MDETSAPATAGADARVLPLEFRATGGEYFRIWIVNLLLTIVTLGIYSAWAKVRRLRYFYGSTALDGNVFEYHGRPIAILKGRLITVGVYLSIVAAGHFVPFVEFLLLPLVLFGMPWVIVRARQFQMRMTSWRGLRFGFHGQYTGALGAFIGWALLGLLTLGALWPLALWKQVRFMATNTSYGTQRFGFTTRVGPFYRFFFATVGVTLLAALLLLGVAVVLGAAAGATTGAFNAAQRELPGAMRTVSLFMTVCMMIGGALVGTLVAAYYRARFLNATLGGIEVGPHRLISRLRFGGLFAVMLTNLLGMIVTLGLFYPWARVRLVQYQLQHTEVVAAGGLDEFVAASDPGPSAIGEEVGDFFDVEFGF